MYHNYISHAENLYFLDNEQFYEYIHKAMPDHILMEPFDQHISRLSPKDFLDMRKRINYLLDDNALNVPINELLVFDYELDDDWLLFPCSKEKFKNETSHVINQISDFYNLD